MEQVVQMASLRVTKQENAAQKENQPAAKDAFFTDEHTIIKMDLNKFKKVWNDLGDPPGILASLFSEKGIKENLGWKRGDPRYKIILSKKENVLEVDVTKFLDYISEQKGYDRQSGGGLTNSLMGSDWGDRNYLDFFKRVKADAKKTP